MNNIDINVHIKCKIKKNIPILKDLYLWIKTIIDEFYTNTNIYIGLQIVNKKKIYIFNKIYKKHDYVTNILAFRYNDLLKSNYLLLGDILICHDMLLKESKLFNKPITLYYANIIIHGILHLLGFDHIKIIERKYMQFLENKYLKIVGF